jgi:urease accessory protein
MFQPFESALERNECGAQAQGWKAELQLQFHQNSNFYKGYAQTTASSRHCGPLRIQKLLYPEGPEICHAIIVHPPGGIAGGDELLIKVSVSSRASALLTTPGASRWYGSMGATASQRVLLNIQGECEWLPMETIVYDQARAHSEIQIDCADQARMIGWDTLIFGRKSFGEDFSQGQFYQTISCRFNDRLLWQERTRLTGEDPLFESAIGFQGQRAASTLWAIRAAHESWTEEELESLRASAPETAWTILWPRLLVGRQLGDPCLLKVRNTHAWAMLRPMVLKRTAIEPRIWAT